MANNELSGPVLAVALAKAVSKQKDRRYTYRFIWIPETIGSITYLSRHLDEMKRNTIAGFVLSCVGDDRTYSYIPSRRGNTLADRVARNVLHFHYPDYVQYTFLDRGSDERQYNAPGVDLPVVGFCRSKYGEYPEYHTSADDMNLISPEGLYGSYETMIQWIRTMEYNRKYQVTVLGEPQLGKRGLYPTISQKGSYNEVTAMVDFIAYADGKNDLFDIANIIGVAPFELLSIVDKLSDNGLIRS
jgi:aminopeptidase-like protein